MVLFSLLLTSFILGLRHALDADHVAAVAALIRDKKTTRESIWHGVVWGLGHTTTLFILGMAVIVFGGSISADFAQGLELAVGVLLVLLGIDVILRVRREKIHFHLHQHGESAPHVHAHSHKHDKQHDEVAHEHRHRRKIPVKTLMVGLMHGMAGASALVLLTLNQIQSAWQAMAYVLVFGVGSIAGMATLTMIIAWPLRRSVDSMSKIHSMVHYSLGLLTVVVGASILLEPLYSL